VCLNQEGYITINKIKTKNKDIGILAIKFEDQKPKFIHFIITLSVRSTFLDSINVEKTITDYCEENFNDITVVEKIEWLIEKHSGSKQSYEKTVVLGLLPEQKKEDIVKEFSSKGVKVYEFSKILSDVVSGLDTHYYKDDIIRSLQLMKYLLLMRPVFLATLLEKEGFNIGKQGKFLSSLLKQEQVQKSLKRQSEESDVVTLLKNSTLNRPEKLAKILVEDVLGQRSKRKFLLALLEHDEMRKVFTQGELEEQPVDDKNQQKLNNF
jgi:hypothetical protein